MSEPLPAAVEIFKSLGHPTRLRCLLMLAEGELCVCQLVAVLGQAPSTVSAHLHALRRAGLLEERKKGRWVLYRLATGETVRAVLRCVRPLVAGDPQLERDADLCRRLRAIGPEELCRVGLDLARLTPSDTAPGPAGPRHEV
ncbi:MAG: ArsR family transcriptional regulator [Acidobacteria bacterium]|nr:MAG: ArsR family transcriptional regulator [Acidobacteriota bacterium]